MLLKIAFLLLCMSGNLHRVASKPYKPGKPGGEWTPDEVRIVRQKILKSIMDPTVSGGTKQIEAEKALKSSGFEGNTREWITDEGRGAGQFPISEMKLIRLAFHDCMKYKDGTGGCDGCINWKNMGDYYKPIFTDKTRFYKEKNIEGDNNHLGVVVRYLEVIYTTLDYPKAAPALNVSLRDSGKSRADLWAFAAHVALERTIERANWGCEYDFNLRKQQTLLESREKCDIKLTSHFPARFMSGRTDCVPSKNMVKANTPFKSEKEEDHPSNWDTAKDILDWMKRTFDMPAREFIALSAIHSAGIASGTLGTKYDWFGYGYLGNMYFKMIANRPIYPERAGGTMLLGTKNPTFFATSVGDANGNPLQTIGWRVSCQKWWKTTEGGPCYMRPTSREHADAPGDPGVQYCSKCKNGWNCNSRKVGEVGPKGGCDSKTTPTMSCGYEDNGYFANRGWGKFEPIECQNAWFDQNGVQHGGPKFNRLDKNTGKPGSGWSGMMALPYEVGLYHKFDMGGPAQKPIGCPGMNLTVDEFPGLQGNFSVQSPAINCPKNDYVVDGEGGLPSYKIVEELADDNEVWAEAFLKGWAKFLKNGNSNLRAGPKEAWLGYYSLEQQGINVGDYKEYINANAPLRFTDVKADPFIDQRFARKTSEFKESLRPYVPYQDSPGCCSKDEQWWGGWLKFGGTRPFA